MSSVAGIRLALCSLRYGPQTGVPFAFFCRKSHSIADPMSTNSEKLSSSRGMSNVADQKQTKRFTVDLSELEKELAIVKSFKKIKRYVTDPGLVNNILYGLDPWDHRTTPIIMECNPGPGVLTRALLDAGCNVVALEGTAKFLPVLKKLEQDACGSLSVLHCDFFRLDPDTENAVEPPSMFSNDLMERIGINEVPWDTGIPIKIFGILKKEKERYLLWRYIYDIYERLSIFRFGRIELNFFMTEELYKNLAAKPGEHRRYRALAVLCNVAFDIQLLHKEHISTFYSSKNVKSPSIDNSEESLRDNLCLVRLTPRKDLFSEQFPPQDGKMFVNMVKQCLTKRKSEILTNLDSWSPGDGEQLLQLLDLPANARTGDISPEDYKLLFELLTNSEDFSQSFVFETCENIPCFAF
ncbi:dimethyladenosine transferase 2, mitochondrial [Rana temporaria]|uniref:dimethyladenosine transferase 2, mitochondrial n=1 Tax=Rana temporaria TaxID=8407 RepID=UPI001AAD0E5D|nr:dimethyladenosine transferase 2, mitochondrial [Rana temporaria]